MTSLEAAEAVLQHAGEPLHSTEMTRRALDQGLWAPTGRTPAGTTNDQILLAVGIHYKPFGVTGSGKDEMPGYVNVPPTLRHPLVETVPGTDAPFRAPLP